MNKFKSKSKSKAQGALEYLLIIGAAILVVAVVIVALTGVLGTGKDNTNTEPIESTYTGLRSILDLGYSRTIINLVLKPGSNTFILPEIDGNNTLFGVFGTTANGNPIVINTVVSFQETSAISTTNGFVDIFGDNENPTNLDETIIPVNTPITIIIPQNSPDQNFQITIIGNEPLIIYDSTVNLSDTSNNNTPEPVLEEGSQTEGELNNGGEQVTNSEIDLFIPYPTENIVEIFSCQELIEKIDANVFGVFVLKNNIDCGSVTNFSLLYENFYGKLDGNNYTISNLNVIKSSNLSNKRTENFVGVFSKIQNSLIQRVKFSNVNILQNTDSNFVGLVSGYAINSTFFRVSAQGQINANKYVGGITGYLRSSNLWNSSSNVTINGEKYVGGIAGHSYQSNVKNTYSVGTNNGTDTVGGLIGELQESQVSNSYSTNSVSASTKPGGLIGNTTGSTVTNSFWNTESSNQPTSAGGIGKTPSELKNINTFIDWNFIIDWKIDPTINSGYPQLR